MGERGRFLSKMVQVRIGKEIVSVAQQDCVSLSLLKYSSSVYHAVNACIQPFLYTERNALEEK